RDLDVHDRLEHDRPTLAHRRQEVLAAGGDEGNLLAVDAVMLAVVDHYPHVDHRIAGDGAGGEHFAHALFHGRDELARNRAALDLVEELEAAPARQRLDAQVDLAELAGTAALLLVPVVAFRWRRDGFAVGDP